jgi:CRP-like cAMP-binding protein
MSVEGTIMSDEINAKIEEFFSKYRLRRYAKGQVLLLGGESTDTVFHLAKGLVKMYDVTYRGDEAILNIFQPPAFFPMSIIINKTPNPYVYEAETDVEIRQAPAEDVAAFIKANPDVTYDLLSRLYRGVDGLLGRMSHLMHSSAKSRVLYELIIEGRRFGRKQKDNSCLLDINEKGLGARAGLSRETVSREIHKLKADNLIEVHVKDILICDMAALEAKLAQEEKYQD